MANAESQQSNEKGAKISSTCTGGMVQCPSASEGLLHFDNIQRIELWYRPALNYINRSKMHKHLTPCVRRRISHTLDVSCLFLLQRLALYASRLQTSFPCGASFHLAWWTVRVYSLQLICAHYPHILSTGNVECGEVHTGKQNVKKIRNTET